MSWLVIDLMCLVKDGIEDVEVMFVGCLPVELDPDEQDVRYYAHSSTYSLPAPKQNTRATAVHPWLSVTTRSQSCAQTYCEHAAASCPSCTVFA